MPGSHPPDVAGHLSFPGTFVAHSTLVSGSESRPSNGARESEREWLTSLPFRAGVRPLKCPVRSANGGRLVVRSPMT